MRGMLLPKVTLNSQPWCPMFNKSRLPRRTLGEHHHVLAGFTLIEVLIVLMLLTITLSLTTNIFKTVLLSWSAENDRAGLKITLERGMAEITSELRQATVVQSVAGRDEIRYTKDGSTFYIYYFYNSADSYVPPPAFDQTSYELRQATLIGGIDGTFTYGSGFLMIRAISAPTTSDLSLSGNIITIDLTTITANATVRLRSQITPRNL